MNNLDITKNIPGILTHKKQLNNICCFHKSFNKIYFFNAQVMFKHPATEQFLFINFKHFRKYLGKFHFFKNSNNAQSNFPFAKK